MDVSHCADGTGFDGVGAVNSELMDSEVTRVQIQNLWKKLMDLGEFHELKTDQF